MEIDVEGRTWTVEQRSIRTLAPQPGTGYCALRFRPRGGTAEEEVEMRWIPRPRELTRALAGRLLLLAGERLWRDARTGALHRVLLEDGERGDEEPETGSRSITVRFLSPEGSVSTAYDVGRPLALADGEQLARLLDRAGAAGARPPARAAGSVGA